MPYRPTARTRARRAERHESLLAAAEHLVAAEGFGAASVVAIAAAAGMSTGAVYSHFPGKADLLAAVFRRADDRELAAVRDAVADAPDAASRLSALVEVFAARALHGRTMAWALLAEPVDPAVDAERLVYRQAYRRIAEEILEAGLADGDLPSQDVALSAAALIGAVGEALVGPLSPVAAHTDAEDLVPSLQALCLRTVGVDSHAPEPRTTREGFGHEHA